jgi:hypothetical protein
MKGGGWSAPCPGRFTPGKDPAPIIQEANMLCFSEINVISGVSVSAFASIPRENARHY